ncbi:MAG TPA: hypothetical protein VGE52_14135, partial [Pirellulales bacterium]
ARGRLGPAVAGLAVAGLAALVAAVVLPFWPATDAEPADQAASRIAARSSPGAASPVGSSMSIGTAALLPREVPEATGAPAVAAASGEPAARVEATSETGQPAAGATKIPTSPALAPLPPRFPARAASWPVGATENVLLGALPAPTTLPDGRRWQVVTASPDARITGLSWNADGRRLACAVGEQVRIYEGATLKLIGYGLTQHGIRCLAWSPEGDRLAALLNTGDVLVWDDRFQVQTTIANQLPYKENFNARLAWTPDGKTVVYALAGHGVVKIDDVAEVEGSSRLTLKAESEALMGAAVSPDGSQVATGSSNGRIRIWGRDGSLIREFPASGTGVLSWSPDGKWIVALATHGSPPVQLWQPDGTPGAVIPHAAAAGVMWRPDSQEFVTVGLDAVTHVWKATGEHVGEVGVQMAGWLGAYSPKGDMFVFAAGSWLHVVDVRESLQTRELAYRAGLDGGTVSWSNEGSRIACGCEHSSVAVWREDGGIDTHFGTLFAGRFAWQREQPTLAYAANWRAGVSVWSGVEGKSVCWGDDGNTRRRALAWSPDGRLTVGTPGELKTWSAPAKMDVSLAIGAGLPMWAAWRPDGSRLAAISDDQSLRIWSAEGDRIADFAPPPGDLWRGLEWSRDGGRLAVLRRNAVALYDPNGVEIGVIQDVDHVVNSISWSHDDRAILGSTSSHAVRIWDVESRGPIGGWKRAGDAATGVSCDPRGPRAAAIQSHGIMHVHNTDDGSVQWVGVLTSHNAFTLSPAGELLAGDREKADLELSCVLEQSDGTFEVYSPSEFEKLVAPHFQAAK